jgi:hypothetical protein
MKSDKIEVSRFKKILCDPKNNSLLLAKPRPYTSRNREVYEDLERNNARL